MFRFPRDLYVDVRIEERYELWLEKRNGELEQDAAVSEIGAMIRVFDGKMWYTCTTNNIDEIQEEIDNLATLATPNLNILEEPQIKILQVHNKKLLNFDKDGDLRKIKRNEWLELVDHYVNTCIEKLKDMVSYWDVSVSAFYTKKSFYSSKGSEIIQDMQSCKVGIYCGITKDGITYYGGKSYCKFCKDELWGHEEEILQEAQRYADFLQYAVKLEPGDYTCVLAPVVTATFAHESFGHKSEADFMLNDKTLRNEWVLGKRVSNEKVSICDNGELVNHGYTPYDDEGTKAVETWLIKDGILSGRLHSANSAVILGEALTGNARAQSYGFAPIVRMTNTYMLAGTDDPEEIVQGVEDGIYVYGLTGGTGQATFTIQPTICYRIRKGKICEPVWVNMITGSVFEALHDVDAVGTDYELFDTYTCGKGNQQSLNVSCGGSTIRVKKLTFN